MPEIVAIDGKTSRRTRDRGKDLGLLPGVEGAAIVSAALSAAGWNPRASTLTNYLKVNGSAGNTILAVAPGSGSGSAITVLTGFRQSHPDRRDHIEHARLVSVKPLIAS